MLDCKPMSTPLAEHFRVSAQESPSSDKDNDKMSKVPYASAVGYLMYALVCTCLDLAQAVSVVSRYMANPGKQQWNAVKRLRQEEIHHWYHRIRDWVNDGDIAIEKVHTDENISDQASHG
ncbi:Hypothetical predicted protein [Prunus dulcis]|uniref:Transposable element protein n=1 Tax=Prunus dulcis TaxID=3755 RepID=A0A5E4F4T7_PRUDU|nr:Hypothetical predicted protein [Prunus dulcis]